MRPRFGHRCLSGLSGHVAGIFNHAGRAVSSAHPQNIEHRKSVGRFRSACFSSKHIPDFMRPKENAREPSLPKLGK